MRGRPKKEQADRRENVLRIRLTESEREALDKAAASKSLDTSSWARMTLMDSAEMLGKRDK